MNNLTKTIKELTGENAVDMFGGDAENIVEELNEKPNRAKEWRDFYKKPGAMMICESPDWLRGGCPICGGKKWEVTGDCWAYCMSCSRGFPTDFPFTSRGNLEELNFNPQKE